MYADIAHPINSECREMIQKRVISEYVLERERSGEPGYVSRYDEDYGAAGSATQPSSKPVREKGEERSFVEPGESEVRPPHRAPSQRPIEKKGEGDFGAGIF